MLRSFLRILPLAFLPALAFAQGTLDPSGAPAPAMKSLDQLEPRIPIGKVGGSTSSIVISAPGSYVLMGNVTVAANAGIFIKAGAGSVTLDLNGFTVSSTASPASGTAIYVTQGPVTIRNGHICGVVTHSPGTTIGFESGIDATYVANVCVENVSVEAVTGYGISLYGGNGIIRSCRAQYCGTTGLRANQVIDSIALNCGDTAIHASTAVSEENPAPAANGIASNCTGESTGGSGIVATTAINCRGTSGSKPGITATAVSNCHGESTDGCGISCTTAGDSFGSSVNSTGLSAATANNCYGYSYNGWGLYATEATTCHGKSEHGTYGLRVENTATGCTGEIVEASSTDGSCGLYAGNASNCTGSVLGTTETSEACYGLKAMTASNCLGTVADHPRYACGLFAGNADNCHGAIGSHTGADYIMPGLGEDPSTGLHAARATNSYGSDKSGRYGLTATFSASFCTGFSFSGATLGTAIKTNLAIGCTSEMGSIVANSKQLGTP